MKQHLKRNLIVLFVTLFSCGAMTAQTNYGIEIAGIKLTSANASAINNSNFPDLGLTSGTITYDHPTKTFTFNNLTANVAGAGALIAITEYANSGNYTINLIGNNMVTTYFSSINTKYNLTIEGSGSLKVTSANECGLYIRSNAALTIRNTIVETVGVWGIAGYDGKSGERLVIENSTVKAYGYKGSIVELQNITLVDCKVTKPVGAAVAANSSNVQAVMLGDSVVKEQVVIESTVINYGIEIAGTELTSANASAINNSNFPDLGLTSGTISYSHSTKTFTLNNVTAAVTKGSLIYITYSADSAYYTINLIGSNVITTPSSSINIKHYLTVKGSGSLKVTSANECGLYIRPDAALTIRNTIVETVGKWGIAGYDGKSGERLVIENSTVKATGTEASICDLLSINLKLCGINKPVGAIIAENGSKGRAVMLDDSVVKEQVVIEPVEYYGIKIAGTELTPANASAINNSNFPDLGLTSGTITYDHHTKTFTFNNLTANVAGAGALIAITEYANSGNYTINLIGNNMVTTTYFSPINIKYNLTIEGGGSLKLISDVNCGIYVRYNVTLTIKNTTVETVGKWGIAGENGSNSEKIVIDNSTVKAHGYGGSILDLQSITLVDCKVTKPVGAAVSANDSYGLAVMLDDSVVTSQVVIEPTTGIATAKRERCITVYPNPVSDNLTIVSEDIGKNVTVTDLSGRMLITTKITNSETVLNVSHLPSGIYMVRVGNKVGKFSKF